MSGADNAVSNILEVLLPQVDLKAKGVLYTLPSVPYWIRQSFHVTTMLHDTYETFCDINIC